MPSTAKEHYYLGCTTDLVIATMLCTNEVDATALCEALLTLRNQWRSDRQVFTVEVIQAMVAVVRETEEVFEVAPVPINEVRGAPFTMEEKDDEAAFDGGEGGADPLRADGA